MNHSGYTTTPAYSYYPECVQPTSSSAAADPSATMCNYPPQLTQSHCQVYNYGPVHQQQQQHPVMPNVYYPQADYGCYSNSPQAGCPNPYTNVLPNYYSGTSGTVMLPSGSSLEEDCRYSIPQATEMSPGKSRQRTPRKRQRFKKDPNEPQKPVSAYALFFRDKQATIKGQNPNASFGEVSKIVAAMWDGLDAQAKNTYKQRTETAKKDYLKQRAAYRATHLASPGKQEEMSRMQPMVASGYAGESYVDYLPQGIVPMGRDPSAYGDLVTDRTVHN